MMLEVLLMLPLVLQLKILYNTALMPPSLNVWVLQRFLPVSCARSAAPDSDDEDDLSNMDSQIQSEDDS